jgi:hypothetical protein
MSNLALSMRYIGLQFKLRRAVDIAYPLAVSP